MDWISNGNATLVSQSQVNGKNNRTNGIPKPSHLTKELDPVDRRHRSCKKHVRRRSDDRRDPTDGRAVGDPEHDAGAEVEMTGPGIDAATFGFDRFDRLLDDGETNRHHHHRRGGGVRHPHGDEGGGAHEAKNEPRRRRSHAVHDGESHAAVEVPTLHRLSEHEPAEKEIDEVVGVRSRRLLSASEPEQGEQSQR